MICVYLWDNQTHVQKNDLTLTYHNLNTVPVILEPENCSILMCENYTICWRDGLTVAILLHLLPAYCSSMQKSKPILALIYLWDQFIGRQFFWTHLPRSPWILESKAIVLRVLIFFITSSRMVGRRKHTQHTAEACSVLVIRLSSVIARMCWWRAEALLVP